MQLNTRTKAFCGCPNAYGAAPNEHTCPVCLGLPVRQRLKSPARVESLA